MRRELKIAAIMAVFATWSDVTLAQSDTILTYQGELKESGGLANGSFDMDFALWDALSGGAQIGGTESYVGVTVSDGRFTVELDFGANAFDNSDRWLQIDVEGTLLSPRQPITRAPYAIQTRGLFVSDAASVGIGTTTPGNALHVESNATNNVAIYGHTSDIYGMGVIGEASSTNGFNAGVRGISHSQVGWGVWGDAEAGGYGVYGTSSGEFARGVSGEGYGAQAKGVSGTGGLYGVYGGTSSSPGYGVYGVAGGTGVTHGVYGLSLSSVGRGLYGYASHPSGVTYGVIGQVDSPAGYAAYFIGPAGSQNYFSRDVGINTLSPNFLLHVNGSAGKPGGGSWSNSSDRRLKKNIADLDGALESLLSLRGVTFEYKDPESINELPGKRIGVIAQEVEAVFPDWVDERRDGYKAVTFRGFEAVAIEALRELRVENEGRFATRDRQIEELRAANELLQNQLVELSQMVEQLRSASSEKD